ncbi:MAG: hypothetical protein JWM05_1545, partial [Acidimicrobiales bacterium]|nr:hypothetical protein [Acidimicrobiales bacterium]
MLPFLVLLVGAVIGFLGSRAVRGPARTAAAASMARS